MGIPSTGVTASEDGFNGISWFSKDWVDSMGGGGGVSVRLSGRGVSFFAGDREARFFPGDPAGMRSVGGLSFVIISTGIETGMGTRTEGIIKKIKANKRWIRREKEPAVVHRSKVPWVRFFAGNI
jgi:hypothetical protein